MVKDPGNYGKFWRIVHRTRRNSPELSNHIKRFLSFQKLVDEKAPRSRLTRFEPKIEIRTLDDLDQGT